MSSNFYYRILNGLKSNPSFKSFKYKDNDKWVDVTRKKLLDNANFCKEKLVVNNIKKGDRVIYKGRNSVEWISWNLAVKSIGAVWVPLYEEQTIRQTQYIVNNCRPKLFISNNKMDLINTTMINNKVGISNGTNFNISENIKDDDLSTLIYTSGTTGSPKGVMLSNNNITSNIDSIRSRFGDIDSGLTTLNILPWAHIYGMTCELYYNLIYDNTIAICSNKNKFIDECGQVRPNVLYLVPKVLDTIKNKLEILDKPIIRIVLPKILNKLLGNNIQNIFIGGAKLDPSTRQFYDNNGIILCEGYGCSETSPMISVNHISYPRNSKSIGKILDNVLVKIIDNEICVHGPNVMKGYWESPTENHNAFIHYDSKKWYKTGDSGFIKDGFLFYKGRISENYKMSNGKFVNVSMVESEIKEFIKTNYIIYGENMEYNVLIVEKPFDKKLLKNINEKLDSYMKIRRIITLSPEQIAEFLTPKQSIKRKALIQFIKDNNYLY